MSRLIIGPLKVFSYFLFFTSNHNYIVFLGIVSIYVKFNRVSKSAVYGCSLPEWAKNAKLQKNLCHFNLIKGGRPFTPANRCFFRAIFYGMLDKDEKKTYNRRQLDRCVEDGGNKLALRWSKFRNVAVEKVGAVGIDDLKDMEKLFRIRLHVWKLELVHDELRFVRSGHLFRMAAQKTDSKTKAHRFRRPSMGLPSKWPEIYVCVIGRHASAIINIDKFAKIYFCSDCELRFDSAWACNRHQKNTNGLCGRKVVRPTKSSWYNVKPTLTTELLAWGITLPSDFDTVNYYGTFDCETYKQVHPPTGETLQYHAILKLVSIAFSCNVPGMKSAVYVNAQDEGALIQQFVAYVEKANSHAQRCYAEKWGGVIDQLQTKSANCGEDYFNPYKALLQRLKFRMHPIRFYGWYSSAFDVPLMLGQLACEIKKIRAETSVDEIVNLNLDVLKKGSKYLNVKWDNGRLQDFSMYMPLGTSLSTFLKTYDITDTGKKIWPHSVFTSPEYLEKIDFPPYEDFWNDLKNCMLVTQEEYNAAKKYYVDEGLKNMSEYLAAYNLFDVEPFLLAIERHIKLMHDHFQINCIEEGLTLSAVAHNLLMKKMEPKLPFHLPTVGGKTLHTLENTLQLPEVKLHNDIRTHSLGGLSVILERIQIRGMTKISPESPYICKNIVGLGR